MNSNSPVKYFVLAAALVMNGASTAAADDPSPGSVTEAAGLVAEATTGLEPGLALERLTSTKANSAIADYGARFVIKVPSASRRGISVETPHTNVRIGIPLDDSRGTLMKDGSTVYADPSHHVHVVVEPTVGGGVRQSFVLGSAQAPTKFNVPVQLPSGATLELQDDGSIVALDATGSSFGGFASPWATDARGESVPTSYEITSEGIAQRVLPGPDTVYPVVADPWWGVQYQLSNKSAQKLILLVNGSAGTSGIVAAICGGTIAGIPCGVAYGVAAGVLVIGGSALSYCNRNNRGININKPWAPAVIYCTSR